MAHTERRRQPPISRNWFNGVSVAVISALVLASWQGTRVYGQQERRVEENAESIDALNTELRNQELFFQGQINNQEENFERKFERIDDKLTDQHGAISGLKSSVDALVNEIQRARRDEAFRQ